MEKSPTETELAKYTCWYLCARDEITSVGLRQIIDFLQNHSIRPQINSSRLRFKLKRDRNVSVLTGDIVQLPRSISSEIAKKFEDVLEAKPEIRDNILLDKDFRGARGYVSALVKQVNGTYQFGFFDACAVIMRRLAEVLIIDAYNSLGQDEKIRDATGHIVMMNGLINALKSGHTFKLSRNTPGYLETLKTLGDTAAHSRSYITKKKDIDDFSQKFRMLIEELQYLTRPSSTPK